MSPTHSFIHFFFESFDTHCPFNRHSLSLSLFRIILQHNDSSVIAFLLFSLLVTNISQSLLPMIDPSSVSSTNKHHETHHTKYYATMNNTQPAPSASSPHTIGDDWETWGDDDMVTPIEPAEQHLMDYMFPEPPVSSTRHSKRVSRSSQTRLNRLKSKHRQRAQNAKAGIKLITDMTAFRRHNHSTKQLQTPDGRPYKFVDAAALRALEGEPNSASVGNWNWLKKDKVKSPVSAGPQSPRSGLSPEDRPIMIGITLPSGEMDGCEVPTPQPAAVNTTGPPTIRIESSAPAGQLVSVWSPDTPTPDTSTNNIFRPASSVYSQATALNSQPTGGNVPPVPALPSTYKKNPHQRLISLEMGGSNGDDDDTGTPCTLFEEDGMATPQSQTPMAKGSARTPSSAESRSRGWWDHVVTPFIDKRLTFVSQKQIAESPIEYAKCEKLSIRHAEINEKMPSQNLSPIPAVSPPPIVRVPTPRRTPSPRSTNQQESPSGPSTARSSLDLDNTIFGKHKPQIIVTDDVPFDLPPPYSPLRGKSNAPVRYRAVFPPGHPLQAQFPPSPGPASPGLVATMTSQGHTPMSDIPITPTIPREMPAPLPTRPIGTYLPQDHFHDARGHEHRVERERRRHEKEEVVARKVGGFWRGRGCVPATGCFGRTGTEGRKKRRICLGIFGTIIALIILAVVLAVVLTRPKDSEQTQSIWVNLTGYPPMPTGVMTVVGPDNTVANSGCTEPSTLWSCALPKEQHGSVAPYKPNQPTIILQIQWDNGTRKSWDIPNGEPPKSVERRAFGGAAHAGSLIRERQTDRFIPEPSPPDFKEMWFLGDTTDGIESDEKAGEPAPFYISVLKSLDETADTPLLSKRQTTIGDGNFIKDLIPAPDLLEDGTPAPAAMLPQAVHQPVRLYDRGLPTEHYAFYTYFKRTIYLKSTTRFNETEDKAVPLDEDGGCAKTEANFFATWAETRMLVQIWTQTIDANTSELLGRDSRDGIDGSRELIRPGTMPYPVTVTLDTHGGNRKNKFVWMWPMDERQKLDEENPKLMANKLDFGGTVVNHRNRGDEAMGGFDGGTGGCMCEWVNWV